MEEMITKKEIVDYGKSHGYTGKEISKVLDVSRNDIIKYGIDNNYKANETNKVLEASGYKKYNPATTLYNYQKLGPNLLQNATDMARDLRTFGGIMVEPLVGISRDVYKAKPGTKMHELARSFKKAVNDNENRKLYGSTATGMAVGSLIPKLGPVGGGLLAAGSSIAGGPKGIANAILSSYDTSLSDLRRVKEGNMSLSELIGNMAQGAFRNPLYATLDTAPVTGRAVGKVATESTKLLPTPIRQLLPTPEQREFNRQITQSLGSAKARTSNVYEGYKLLDTMPLADRVEILKDITTNKSKLNPQTKALAERIKKDLRAAEDEFIKRGYLDRDFSKSNTVAQYVMQFLDDDRILHGHIDSYIRGKNFLPGREKNIRITTGDPYDLTVEQIIMGDNKLRNKINKLIAEGDKLYDEGKIAFFTQKFAPIQDILGNVIASKIAKTGEGYFGTKRIIGKQKPEVWAKAFDKSLKFQLDELSKITEAEDVVNDIISKYNLQDASNLDKVQLDKARLEGKEVFSKEAFKDYIKSHFEAGKDVDLAKALNHARTTGEGSILVDKMYLDAINNAFRPTGSTGPRRLLNSFKKAVLANPHWIILNRIGNMTNNFMEGVTLSDYHDAKIYKDLIPNQLKQQISFNSYINAGIEGVPTGTVSAIKQPINRWIRAGEKFKSGSKALQDYWELGTERAAAASDTLANVFFKMESGLELNDRAANIIRQAKREGQRTGKDWRKILKEAETNNDLFMKLNNRVNKSLGDYVGKNYMMPQGYYNFLSEGVPFYRFLTQTMRTTANQLLNNPGGFASNVTIPSRIGKDISERVIDKYNLKRDEYKGGIPYSIEADGNVRTIGFEPLPIGAVSEDFAEFLKGEDLTSMLSPYWTSIPDILKFRRFNRMATTPRNPSNDENYKPRLSDVLMYGANTFGSTINAPYRIGTTYLPEINSLLFSKGLQSRYDTNPFVQNPNTYMRTLPVELVGRYFGIQTKNNRVDKPKSKTQQQKEIKKQIYMLKHQQQLKDK